MKETITINLRNKLGMKIKAEAKRRGEIQNPSFIVLEILYKHFKMKSENPKVKTAKRKPLTAEQKERHRIYMKTYNKRKNGNRT